jgi:hypothetical protein
VKVEPLPADTPVTVGPYRLVLLAAPAPRSSSTSIPGTVIASAPEPPPERTARVEAAANTSHTEPGAKTIPPVPPAPAPPRPAPTPAAAAKAPAPPARGTSSRTLVIAGVAVAALAAVAVFAMLSGGSAPQPESAPATETPQPAAQATSTVPPPQPTDEERFREHFDKAQGFIQAGDKANAESENTAALAILPNDERGLKQRLEIEGIGAPPAPVPAPGPDVAANKKKEPAPPSSMTVAPRANESASERASREKNARYLLEDGKKAFDERRFADAIDMLQRALEQSGREDFGSTPGEAASVLKLARTAKANADAAAARATAQKLFDQAKAMAATDVVGAARRLREAQQADARLPGIAELMASLQEQAVTQGEAALTSAKNFDRFKRIPDAIREYDRAVQLLDLVPGGHKDLAFAKQRSAELKGR